MKLLPALFLAMFALPLSAQTPPIEPGVSQQLARWRAAHYSDVRYKLNLTLEKMSPVLKGTIEIKVKIDAETPGRGDAAKSVPPAVAGGAVAPIVLDWRKIRGSENLSTITNVSLNGTTLKSPHATAGDSDTGRPAFQESNEHLIFRDGVRAGENVIKLDFTSPILPSGSAITRYIDKEDGSEYIYSLFVPSDASTAFPVFDQPDLKARFTLRVKRPDGWRVISNAEGSDLYLDNYSSRPFANVFPETKPISTYVFAFAAGPWVQSEPPAVAGGLMQPASNSAGPDGNRQPPATAGGSDPTAPPTHIYVRKSQAAKFQPHAAEVFRLNREGIRYLEEYFDYKFPFPKYDIVLIPEFPFGGMEHAGATFLRESSVIFPSEPTANDYISRANVIFHEAAHQWFGDTVTMRWFDDLWLKEGFAEFMAYKTLERVMPQYNAWKAFYERNKPAAYFTDSTRGTTPIYQEIANLSAAKSAYGSFVYRKAPSFLRQAEFYLGPDKFQIAVRAFLKKHEYANATWQDLVKEFQTAAWSTKGYPYWSKLTAREKKDLKARDAKILSDWANAWITQPGVPTIKVGFTEGMWEVSSSGKGNWSAWSGMVPALGLTLSPPFDESRWAIDIETLFRFGAESEVQDNMVSGNPFTDILPRQILKSGYPAKNAPLPDLIFPNYQDYGYGIFLLDDKSRDYVLKNIQNEKDDFLRSMMWGALWDSVREAELDPREYTELAIKNLPSEKDEMITTAVLGRVSTAMTYYLSEPPAVAGGLTRPKVNSGAPRGNLQPPATAGGSDLSSRLENMLIERMRNAPTLGQRITYYRAFLNVASTENARNVLKRLLAAETPRRGDVKAELKEFFRNAQPVSMPMTTEQVEAFRKGAVESAQIPLKTKDRFDIVTRLAILNDPDAPKVLADLEKTETSDDAKRYAYAAKAAFPTKENRQKFWNDFVNNKDISESWIEAAFGPFNSPKHSDLSLPYLERALKELPNLKRNRKIFFVNGWLGAFIGGQKNKEALDTVNKFLADNPNLDRDLRLKILENVDIIERAVRIRSRFTP